MNSLKARMTSEWLICHFCLSFVIFLILMAKDRQTWHFNDKSQTTVRNSLMLILVCLSIECFHMTSRRPYWCPKTMKRRPCWCPKPVLFELNSFLMQTLSFVPINLHRCWPREWKHSINDNKRSSVFWSIILKQLLHRVSLITHNGQEYPIMNVQ